MYPNKYYYTREDVARLAGVGTSAISQHVRRGSLRLDSLESVLGFLLRHGNDEMRYRLISKAIVGRDAMVRQQGTKKKPPATRKRAKR